MTLSPPGHWLLKTMVNLINRTLVIINRSVENGIQFLLQNTNTFTGVNRFMGGINVDNIDSINGNTTFNSEIIVNSNITANNGTFIGDNLVINNIEKNTGLGITFQDSIHMNNNNIGNINNLVSGTVFTDSIATNTTPNVTFQRSINMRTNDIENINTLISGNLYINNIEKNTNSNVTFKNSIDMNNNNIDNINSLRSGNLYIDNISIKTSGLPYITVNHEILLNKDVQIDGNLSVKGSTMTVNTENLTVNNRFITLNANIESSDQLYTDPAGFIVNTHNATEYSRGYLLWTLFDPNDPTNTDRNRTWDLSGDNLRGNVLKATTLRGNIIDSYYSPNISVISDIDMSNNDISNINILTAKELNIDVIKTNTAANISVLNTIDMNNNYIINANIAALNHSQINVEGGIIEAQNLILGGFNADQTNGVTFRSRHGLNPLGSTKIAIHPSGTLYLPENNGATFGSNHTKSIIGIGGLFKVQNNTQQFYNSQCYLIPPSMIGDDIPELKGTRLFKTIGKQNERIRYLAGYQTANIGIHELRNTLVPTVGQIVDLLDYLGVSMQHANRANNLKSTYS